MNQDDHIITRRSMIRAASVTAGAAIAGKTVFAGATAAADTAGADTPAPADPPAGRYRIDMHAHFLPPRYRESLLAHGHFLIGGYPLPEWSPEAAVSFMDDWGIQAQVLSVSDPAVAFVRGAEAHDLARYCNDYASDLIARQGDRFGALATLPSLDQLRGKLIGLIQAPATKIAAVVQAPAGQLARVFNAYATKDAA